MNNKVQVFDGSSYRKKVISRIKSIENNILLEPSKDALSNQNTLSRDVVQKLFWSNPSCRIEKTVNDLIRLACVKSESIAGGGGEIALSLIVDMLNMAFLEGEELSQFNLDAVVDEIRCAHHSLHRSNLGSALSPLKSHPDTYSIIKEVLSVSKRSTIKVERSNSVETRIKVSKGSSFDISCPTAALPPGGEWKKNNVKVFIVDGIIESVSEINTILEKASEDRENYLIIARSFLPDVMSTILFNLNRGTINLIPVSTKIDEITFNVFTDLSVVCGTDVVTHLKGDSISQASKRKMCILKNVTVTENNIKIFNPSSKDQVRSHIKNLHIRERNSKNEIEANMIKDRIRRISQSLSSVEIGLYHMKKDPKVVEKIDKFLRSYTSMLKTGFVQKRDLLKIFKKRGLINSYRVLKSLDQNLFSYQMLIDSIRISESCAKSINSAGSIIISDI